MTVKSACDCLDRFDFPELSISGEQLSAPSPGDDLRSKSAIRLGGQTVRSDSFWGIGCDVSAVTIRLRFAMHSAMRNGQICFSLRKFLAISPAIQKITSDCGCDAVVHLGEQIFLKERSPSYVGHTAIDFLPPSVWDKLPEHMATCTFGPGLTWLHLAAIRNDLEMCRALSVSGVAPANQTKERPVHELFAGAFRNKSSICESCLFS